MTDGGRLTTSLQENLLVLLAFNDKASVIIRNAVDPHLFSAHIYRDIVQRIYEYIDQYKCPPGDHLPDLLEEELSSDKPSAKLYLELLEAAHSMRDKVNEVYALDQLEAFVRKQTLKSSIIRASEAIQDDDLDRAEADLNEGMKTRLSIFDPGITLSQGLKAALDGTTRENVVPTGIAGLDKAHYGPARGELHLFLGPPKKGKSWWLVHMTKQCLLNRYKTVVITLELSEAMWAQRLLQSVFSLSRHKTSVQVTRLEQDELGRLLRFKPDNLTGRLSLDDPATRPVIEKKLHRLYSRDNVIIKQFPAGMLTVRGLVNYLDMLERAQNFIPDFIVIDYPDYMQIDPKNYRLESGALYNDLRGLAVSRNTGIIAASKLNREGSKAKLATENQAGEDFSRIFTADSILVYSQTPDEKKLGLARLGATNSRVADRDGFVLLLSQAYAVGQFCLDSTQMVDSYWGHLENVSNNEPPPEGE